MTMAPPSTTPVESLLDLWNARLPCDEDGCDQDAAWRCACPFDRCPHAVLLCEGHQASSRQIVLQLLARPTGFIGCPVCQQRYPRQSPFRRWVRL